MAVILNLIVVVLGTIVVPFLLHQSAKLDDRAKKNSETQSLFSNKLLETQRQIDHIMDLIKGIHAALDHRSEVAQLKYNIIKDKIDDLESYLEKMGGYMRKSGTRRSDQSRVRTMTTEDDDDDIETGIFR